LTEKEEEWKIQEELEKKKKKGKKDEVENPNQVLEWKYLPKELLMKMIVERTSHED
jgi:predicted Holliday junction resolvase-like endonuclease